MHCRGQKMSCLRLQNQLLTIMLQPALFDSSQKLTAVLSELSTSVHRRSHTEVFTWNIGNSLPASAIQSRHWTQFYQFFTEFDNRTCRMLFLFYCSLDHQTVNFYFPVQWVILSKDDPKTTLKSSRLLNLKPKFLYLIRSQSMIKRGGLFSSFLTFF